MLSLDSVLELTRGNPLEPRNLLSQLNPVYGIYTGVFANEHGQTELLAQIRYPLGAHSAHLAFLLPDLTCNSIALPGLLEHLAVQVGEWGALYLIGEVEEHSLAFEAMRRAGFSNYTWQRIWRFDRAPEMLPDGEESLDWKNPRSSDSIPVRILYQFVVPGLIQPVEGQVWERLHGLVYRQHGELLAYADLVYGPEGTWVQPFIHPEVAHVDRLLVKLVTRLRRERRPVYLCVRSYQAWLESPLEDLSAQVGPRQAVMVKRLALAEKVSLTVPVSAMEKGRAEMAHVENIKNIVKRKSV